MTEGNGKGFYLSEKQVEFFHKNGYIGPFDLYDSEYIINAWNKVKFDLQLSSRKPHGARINYDRHLDNDFLAAHICRDEIVHRVKSLIGENVMVWRTEFFPKYPGQAATGWHQEKTFQLEENKPLLKFPADDDTYALEATVWCAFTDCRLEQGCLRFIPGTHTREYYDDSRVTYYGTQDRHDVFGYDFIEKQVDEEWDPEKEEQVNMPLKAGQFVIFASRTVHGALPNVSDEMRLGFTGRYITPAVKVYDGVRELREHGEVINLDYAGCVLVSGEDRYGHNRRHEKNFNGREFVASAAGA